MKARYRGRTLEEGKRGSVSACVEVDIPADTYTDAMPPAARLGAVLDVEVVVLFPFCSFIHSLSLSFYLLLKESPDQQHWPADLNHGSLQLRCVASRGRRHGGVGEGACDER